MRGTVRRSRLTILIVLAGTAVAVLMGVALVPHGQPSSKALEPSSSPAPEWLVALAQKAAANTGDPSPDSAVWALTTYAKAGPSLGGTAKDLGRDPGQEVYLVIMTGDFVNRNSFSPANVPDSKCSTLVFGADPVTHRIDDFGLGNAAANSLTVERMSRLVF
jgi:hypothetical protein